MLLKKKLKRMNNHVTQLTIDLNAADFNLNFFKQKLSSTTKVLVVVKAFGYGSDAQIIAKHLEPKIDYFAVAYTEEGIALRNAGIKAPILVLHPQIPNLNLVIDYNLEPNLYSFRTFDAFLKLSNEKQLSDYPVHLKFNTGLNRLGFLENDLEQVSKKLKDNTTIKVKSLFSHLVASEDENERSFSESQIQQFNSINQNFKSLFGYIPMLHMCNTSGTLNYPEAHYDMVRIGIGILGFGNSESITAQLKNVVSLKSIISQIHRIEKGESIGYNRGFVANRAIKTATIPVGHADGIHRSLGNQKGFVYINNQKARILGNVCMDMIMADVSEINCNEGDEVILFNDQETIEELAAQANTISYELLTAISQRITRTILA